MYFAKRTENCIQISRDEGKEDGRAALLTILIRFALVISGAFLLLFAICQALEIALEPWIYAIIGASAVYGLFCAYRKKRMLLWLIPGIVLFTWHCYRQQVFIQDGFFHLENAFINKYNLYYGGSLSEYVTQYGQESSLTSLFVVVFAPVVVFLAVSVTKRQIKHFWAICIGIVLAMLLFVDVFPETWCLLLLIAHAVFVSMWWKLGCCGAGERNRMMGILTAALFVTMLLSCVIISESVFEDSIAEGGWRKDLRRSIRKWDLEKSLGEFGKQLDSFLSGGNGSSKNKRVGMAGGVLDATGGELKSTGQTHLRVTMPDNMNRVYLRGFVGVNYDGERWSGLTGEQKRMWRESNVDLFRSTTYTGNLIEAFFTYGETEETPLWSAGYRLQEYMADMHVEIVGGDPSYLYAPYDTVAYSEGTAGEDGCLQPDGYQKEYDFRYCYNLQGLPFYYAFSDGEFAIAKLAGSRFSSSPEVSEKLLGYQGNLMSRLQVYQRDYRGYVNRTYLQIPDNCSGVVGLVSSTGVLWKDIENVTEYLRKHYSYTLNPQPPEEGEDYIEHFLLQSHEGYCMHFASAGVMLFRSLGIPARYVEGYVISSDEISSGTSEEYRKIERLGLDGKLQKFSQRYITVDVPDDCAHAWVEIYLDYYGWYPVEVTSGYPFNTTFQPLPSPTPDTRPATPTPTKAPTPTRTAGITPGGNPSLTPTRPANTPGVTGPETTGSVTGPSHKKPTPGTGGTKGETGAFEDDGAESFFRTEEGVLEPVRLLLIILLCAGIAVLLHQIAKCVKQRRRTALTTGSGQQRAFRCYREMLKVLAFAGLHKNDGESDSEFCERAQRAFAEKGAPVLITRACELVQKGRFSRDGVTKKEAEEVLWICAKTSAMIKKDLRGLKKWWFSVITLYQ